MSEAFKLPQPFSLDDVRAVLADAAATIRERPLLPPAEAAFVNDFGAVLALAALTQVGPRMTPAEAAAAFRDNPRVWPSSEDLDALASLSHRLLEAYLADEIDSTEFPRPKQDERHSVALQYAEAVLRQEEIIEALRHIDSGDSPLQATLAGADRERIDEFLLYRNLRGRFETLDSLVEEWRRLVTGLESHPESLVFEEYENWLTLRDSLDQALSLVSPSARKELEALVVPLDERFVEATRAVPTSIKPGSPWVAQRWWWFRVPRRLGEHLRDRLGQVAPTV